VAVERTNFVLIEKSPAPNPIYKPANMAGVGRSLARLRLAASYRASRESRYTQRRPGFRVSHAPDDVSGIRGLKVGEPWATTWPRKKNEERNAGRLPTRTKFSHSIETERQRKRERERGKPGPAVSSRSNFESLAGSLIEYVKLVSRGR